MLSDFDRVSAFFGGILMFKEASSIRTTLAIAVLALLVSLSAGPGAPLSAQEEEESEEDKIGWANVTDLSLVVTEGNANTETFGFKNVLRRNWQKSRYTLTLEAVRSNTADDIFAVTENPDNTDDVFVVKPAKTLDVERYLIENRFSRKISETVFWDVGASWDRNKDAGIINRYVGWAGFGKVWWDREDLAFDTSLGLSYTDRQEDIEDPEKDDSFAGLRFGWDYLNKWGKITTFTNVWNINANISQFSDWSSIMTSAISVSLNSRIALRVSLQWLYNNMPALEEIDVFFFTPDGDEVLVGSTLNRKEKLDTTFATSIVINF